ncbi:hypothetical protein FX988_04042 [Paraglaciecola mesophila]|uniref:Uncharacterized protein n=1 Tax=Paraglaciecola mesophila TaxID=197222 RepID=A0A857JQQ4_9ALTE|nr:hypothetical protein [Paraglaciecola mesophila]QHJ13762.1 hypothetical protein FX988_04042 [Paraglaciecola mesophila]
MATATCWQCGTFLEGIITPVSRREECSQCQTDIHACKMCLYYDAQNRTGCDEERAEYIVDKERANFCEYYGLSSKAFDDTKLDKQRQAKAQLAALFGDDTDDNIKSDTEVENRPKGSYSIDPDDKGSASDLIEHETPAQAAERKLRALLNQ